MHRCKECDDVITNPVCDGCLTNEFDAWLLEFSPYLEKRFLEDCAPYLSSGEAAGSCILCGDPIEVCPFCTTKEFLDWLRSMGVHRRVVGRAKRVFAASTDRKFL